MGTSLRPSRATSEPGAEGPIRGATEEGDASASLTAAEVSAMSTAEVGGGVAGVGGCWGAVGVFFLGTWDFQDVGTWRLCNFLGVGDDYTNYAIYVVLVWETKVGWLKKHLYFHPKPWRRWSKFHFHNLSNGLKPPTSLIFFPLFFRLFFLGGGDWDWELLGRVFSNGSEKDWFLAFKKLRKGLKNRKRFQFGCLNSGKNPKPFDWWEQRVVVFFWQIFLSLFQASMPGMRKPKPACCWKLRKQRRVQTQLRKC